MNKIKVEICGTTYPLSVEGDPEYYENLAKELNAKMTEIMQGNERISVTCAAVLCALETMDESSRTSTGADNLRSQLKGYLEDARNAQLTAENAARELRELRAQLEKSQQECDRLRREVGYMKGQED